MKVCDRTADPIWHGTASAEIVVVMERDEPVVLNHWSYYMLSLTPIEEKHTKFHLFHMNGKKSFSCNITGHDKKNKQGA